MSFQQLMARRLEHTGPIKVGLIGAGKFGSMFLSQIPSTPGICVSVIADLDLERAKSACAAVGWSQDARNSVRFVRRWLRTR